MQLTPTEAAAKVLALANGNPTWGTALGVGSFLTLEIGKVEPPRRPGPGIGDDKPHGDLHVWVYCSAWRIQTPDAVLASSEDDRELLAKAVLVLDGKRLTAVRIASPSLAASFTFDDGTTLEVFPIFTDGYEHWMIYLPDGDVITAGPGPALTIGR
ncbi:MAG: hypothetical protein WAS07_05190 [Micropruina sp.]